MVLLLSTAECCNYLQNFLWSHLLFGDCVLYNFIWVDFVVLHFEQHVHDCVFGKNSTLNIQLQNVPCTGLFTTIDPRIYSSLRTDSNITQKRKIKIFKNMTEFDLFRKLCEKIISGYSKLRKCFLDQFFVLITKIMVTIFQVHYLVVFLRVGVFFSVFDRIICNGFQ